MSNITLDPISVPGLGSGSYGANIKTQFDNIDSNFTKIVQGEYLKGQSGDIVMLEEIDLLNSTLPIKRSFLEYISKFGLSSNGIGSINSQKLYMIYTKNEETEGKIYKSSLPYTFLDPRFNPVSDSAKDEGLEDKSCIIIYDESKGGFKSYNAFPNIYFEGDRNEFCWKINGQKTLLPARGPKGDTGYTGAVYILSAASLPSTFNPQTPQHVKVNFLIKPQKYSEWKETYIINDVAEELKDQAAFVYVNYKGNQYIYISQIETSVENNATYAVCRLDYSCEIHHIFTNQTLKDVLTEVKPESSFNYLFIPSKFENGQLKEAHVVTTKRSGDDIALPLEGFLPSNYNIDTWKGLNDPNVCIISPATFDNSNSKRILPDRNSRSGILYNNYKYTVCPGSAYFGSIKGRVITFENINDPNDGHWYINGTDGEKFLLRHSGGSTEGSYIVSMQGTSLEVSNNLSVAKKLSVDGNATVGGNATIENELVLKNSMRPVEGNTSFLLDAQTGGMRLQDLNVIGTATIGELGALNYKVPSLILPNSYNINNPQDSSVFFVYLTWNVRDTDKDIPTIADYKGEKEFLQAGKPKYIINTTSLRGGASTGSTASTRIHLTFDMSKDWPPTQIEWNFRRTPETISFANGQVKIYTDFRINTNGDTDNCIIVQTGVSGIDFTNYTGDLNQITSILLTPYDAASTPEYKAYKLTFEDANAFSYMEELTGVENKLKDQMIEIQAQIANEYLPKTQFNWTNMSEKPEIPVMSMDNDNITIQSGNNSFVFPTNINNKIQSQIEATLSDKNFVTKGTKFSWNDIEGAPEIPEFDVNGDTVTLKAGKSSVTLPANSKIPTLKMENDNIIIQSGDDSFILPTNLNSKIQTQIEATLSDKDFVTKGTLTMMGGFNPGTNSDNVEPTIQILSQQSEGYTITDFCNITVRYLDGNKEVPIEKYLQWPVKGNVIRGVYHPSTSEGTLSMMVDVTAFTVVTINGVTATVESITIDGRDPLFGLGCAYGSTKTLPWEAKLVGDKSSESEAVRNFKTTVSGYVTLTYAK